MAKKPTAEPKIIVEAGALAKALRDIAPVAKNKDQGSQILSNVLIDCADGVMVLTATNLEQQISRRINIESKISVCGCVEASRFSSLASALDAGSQVEFTFGDSILGIASGRAKFRLNALPATDFPIIPKPDTMVKLSLGDEFIRGLRITRHAVSTSDVQWHLRGIQVRADGNITATDASRMARANFGAFEADFPTVVIPTETVDMILRLCDDETTLELEIVDGKIWIDLGDTTISSKTIEGAKWPLVDAIIPPDDAIAFTVIADRKSLIDALTRIIIVVEGKDRIVKLTVEGNAATFSNQSQGDQGSEYVEVTSTGDFIIGLNSAYLRDALSSLEGHEVEFGVVDPLKPIRLRTLDHETIMLGPLRV